MSFDNKRFAEWIHKADNNPDVKALQDLLLFGMKGMAAYADHALVLGMRNDS